MCYRVKKAHGNGLYFRKNPPYLLPGINYDGLFVKHKGRVYNGEGLILGKIAHLKTFQYWDRYFKKKVMCKYNEFSHINYNTSGISFI